MNQERSDKFKKTMTLIDAGHVALTIYGLSSLDGEEKTTATKAAYEKMAAINNLHGFADIYMKAKPEGRIKPEMGLLKRILGIAANLVRENSNSASPTAIRTFYDLLLHNGFSGEVLTLALQLRELTKDTFYDPTVTQLLTVHHIAEQRNEKQLFPILSDNFDM